MNTLVAFLRLIRWKNICYIVLAQIGFYYLIIVPYLTRAGSEKSVLTPHLFGFLLFSTVCIAAAGNAINDYFDIEIDKINKPEKIIIGKVIHRRWVIVWHLLLSLLCILAGFYLDGCTVGKSLFGLLNISVVVLLFCYSAFFKKRILIGNILIALLSGWVLLFVVFQDVFVSHIPLHWTYRTRFSILSYALVYATFAFVLTMVREVVKDVEDMKGDAVHGCRTLPIVWGVVVSKTFALVWMVALGGFLCMLLLYCLRWRWWVCVGWIIILLYLFFRTSKKIFTAQSSADFGVISGHLKYMMGIGIMSMIALHFYL